MTTAVMNSIVLRLQHMCTRLSRRTTRQAATARQDRLNATCGRLERLVRVDSVGFRVVLGWFAVGSVRFAVGSGRFGPGRSSVWGLVRFGSVLVGSKFGSGIGVRFGYGRIGVRFVVRFSSVRFVSGRFGSVHLGSARSDRAKCHTTNNCLPIIGRVRTLVV